MSIHFGWSRSDSKTRRGDVIIPTSRSPKLSEGEVTSAGLTVLVVDIRILPERDYDLIG
jgi:hypothetical protein